MKATTDAKSLLDAIRAVMPAMSSDGTRPRFNCVHLAFSSAIARATATDGHWMAAQEIDCSVQEPGGAGIAPLFLTKLLAALDGVDGHVAIVGARGKVQFAIDGVGTIATVAIENCPAYETVWPDGKPTPQPVMGMSPKLLSRVATAFGRDRGAVLKFEFYGELSPIIISTGHSRLKACLMPCRTH